VLLDVAAVDAHLFRSYRLPQVNTASPRITSDGLLKSPFLPAALNLLLDSCLLSSLVSVAAFTRVFVLHGRVVESRSDLLTMRTVLIVEHCDLHNVRN
jgi:hypothetical protein